MTLEQAAKAFPLGAVVKYFPLLRDKDTYHQCEIRSEPWFVCGTVVLKVTGIAGCVDIDHLVLEVTCLTEIN